MREKERKILEVHVAWLAFTQEGKILIAQRSSHKKFYPELRECGGGQVYPWENFEEAITRRLKEELWVNIKVIGVLWTYEIPAPELEQKKVPGIKLVCKIEKYIQWDKPQISSEHIQRKIISVNELDKYNFISGIKEEIQQAYNQYII